MIDEEKTIPHKLTGKCTESHQVVITHRSEVDPTGIDGSSNFSEVISLVKLEVVNLVKLK